MTRTTTRLRRLEASIRPEAAPEIRILWPDELMPCPEHTRCDIDRETGTHHHNVIHLSFRETRA